MICHIIHVYSICIHIPGQVSPVFLGWEKPPQATPQTWCQKIVDENQELLIGDLTICEEEKDAFIFDASLAIHSL